MKVTLGTPSGIEKVPSMRIIVLPGDGIGPEISEATVAVLETANRLYRLHLSFDYDDVGFESLKKYGTTLRDETLPPRKRAEGTGLTPTINFGRTTP